jgi:ATP-dependent protease HslVU (ClpYQ) peptidase subunit
MTIIAYRDGVMAADKASIANGYMNRVTKVHRLQTKRWGEVLFGACGFAAVSIAYREYLEGKRDLPKMEDYVDHGERYDNTILIVAKKPRLVMSINSPFFEPVYLEDKFTAIGSGSSFVLGAMAAGVSAYQSIKLATGRVDSVGGGIDTVRFT